MKKVLILGATSSIAQKLARLLAGEGASLFLVARDSDKLCSVRDDLAVRGADQLGYIAADLNDVDGHERIVARAKETLKGLDGAILAYGVLGPQKECEKNYATAEQVLTTNFMSPISLLTILANEFEAQGSGTLVALSSVAGDRGRQSNYIYGASKAGLNAFLQGLRNRLHGSHVRVLTVKPGFVDTPMTQHLKKNALFASPERVAEGILSALQKNKDVVYLPGFWWFIMLILKSLPERLFKRLKL